MTLIELDNYLNDFLKKEDFAGDVSLNGIQIQNANPSEKQIKKIAFAVDACKETAQKAWQTEADVLIVHHGLFWGRCQTLTGSFYNRVSEFINHDLALIAYHLPLDANNPYGNNYGLANKLNLQNLEPFGFWHGMSVGVKGELENPLTIDEIQKLLLREKKSASTVLRFGKEKIKTIGIISGGASEDVEAAIQEKLDLYITGEFEHAHFHIAKENCINVIAAGHYETEIIGVNLLMKKIQEELKIDCEFIDVPTEL